MTQDIKPSLSLDSAVWPDLPPTWLLAKFEKPGVVWTELMTILGTNTPSLRARIEVAADLLFSRGTMPGTVREAIYGGESVGTRIHYRLTDMEALLEWAKPFHGAGLNDREDHLERLEALRQQWARYLLETL